MPWRSSQTHSPYDHLTATCTSSFYAIRKLKTHGFSSSSIHSITKATIVAKLLYASPSCWGLTLASDRERFEKVIRRAKRLEYIEESFPKLMSQSLQIQPMPNFSSQLCITLNMFLTNTYLHSDLTPPINSDQEYILPTQPYSPTQGWISIYPKFIISRCLLIFCAILRSYFILTC